MAITVTLPDLRNVDPSRAGINEDTVVFDDLAEKLIEASSNLARLEDSLMSRYGTATIADLDELIRRAQFLRKRVTNERRNMNKAFRSLSHTGLTLQPAQERR